MKRLICNSHSLERGMSIEEAELPEPGPGQVRVRVSVCGLNFTDGLMVLGKHQLKPSLPFVPGGEFSGVVDALGIGVIGWSPGQRVCAYIGYGALSEYLVVSENALTAVPPNASDAEAACWLLSHGTALYALECARLRPSDHVLVLGAGSGVGAACIAVAKVFGARIDGTVSNEAKGRVALHLGATSYCLYRETDLREWAKEQTQGRGYDVVVDPVGGELGERALRTIAWNGRYLIVGFASGRPASFEASRFLIKGASAVGIWYGEAVRRAPDQEAYRRSKLATWLAQRQVVPNVTARLSLDSAAQGIADVYAGSVGGKCVVALQ